MSKVDEHFREKAGGDAFPQTFIQDQPSVSYLGMTLRDYFAAKAMVFASDGETLVSIVKKELGLSEDTPYDYTVHWPQYIALQSYRMADAMIKQREL